MPKVPTLDTASRMQFFNPQDIKFDKRAIIGRSLENLGKLGSSIADNMDKVDRAAQHLRVSSASEDIQNWLIEEEDRVMNSSTPGVAVDPKTLEDSYKKFYSTNIAPKYKGDDSFVRDSIEVEGKKLLNTSKQAVVVKARKKQADYVKEQLDEHLNRLSGDVVKDPDSLAMAVGKAISTLVPTMKAINLDDVQVRDNLNKVKKDLTGSALDGLVQSSRFDDATSLLQSSLGKYYNPEERKKVAEWIDDQRTEKLSRDYTEQQRKRQEEERLLNETKHKNFVTLFTKKGEAQTESDQALIAAQGAELLRNDLIDVKDYELLAKADSPEEVIPSAETFTDMKVKLYDGADPNKMMHEVSNLWRTNELTHSDAKTLMNEIESMKSKKKADPLFTQKISNMKTWLQAVIVQTAWVNLPADQNWRRKGYADAVELSLKLVDGGMEPDLAKRVAYKKLYGDTASVEIPKGFDQQLAKNPKEIQPGDIHNYIRTQAVIGEKAEKEGNKEKVQEIKFNIQKAERMLLNVNAVNDADKDVEEATRRIREMDTARAQKVIDANQRQFDNMFKEIAPTPKFPFRR